MSTCSNCGTAKNSTLKIILWCAGIGLVGMIGLPIMLIALLAVVAAVGSNANSEFDADMVTAPVSQVSQPAEDSVLSASDRIVK